jgi:hypothetical protein
MKFTEESIAKAGEAAVCGYLDKRNYEAAGKAAIAQLVPVEEPKPEVNGDLVDKAIKAGREAIGEHHLGAILYAKPFTETVIRVVRDEAVQLLQKKGYMAQAALLQDRLLRAATVEDRVAIILTKDDRREVLVDGKYTGIWFVRQEPAEIYRLGLIAKLKQEEGRDA